MLHESKFMLFFAKNYSLTTKNALPIGTLLLKTNTKSK